MKQQSQIESSKKDIQQQYVINKCELVYNCKQLAIAEYISTNNNNKTNYILLQTKYEQ